MHILFNNICFFQQGSVVRKTCREIQASPLHLAAGVGDTEICQLLLQSDKHLVNMRNVLLATPLHIAAEFNRPEVVKLLLQWYDITEIANQLRFSSDSLSRQIAYVSPRNTVMYHVRCSSYSSACSYDQ